MEAWWWIVYALAVARVTNLITGDVITKPGRDWLFRRLNPDKESHELLAELVECRWCMSIWVALLLVPAFWVWGGVWPFQLFGLILATSQVTGMLNGPTTKLGRPAWGCSPGVHQNQPALSPDLLRTAPATATPRRAASADNGRNKAPGIATPTPRHPSSRP